MQQGLKRYETYYILLHVAGVFVFQTLNVGVLGATPGLQALVVLTFFVVGFSVAFDSVPHVPLFIKTRAFIIFSVLGFGVMFVLNLWQNVFRSSANTYVPPVFARLGQSCVATVLLFFGKFVFRIVYDRYKQRQDGLQRSNLISIGVRYKLVAATAAAQMEQSMSNLFVISDNQPLQIEVEPVLEDAMDSDTARVALQRMKRKNLVRTRGSMMLSFDEQAAALDFRAGRGALSPQTNAWGGGAEDQEDRSQREAKSSVSEAAQQLSAYLQLSTSLAVCFPIRPVNDIELVKRISMQRWYFALVIVASVGCLVIGMDLFQYTVASILSSCVSVFLLYVEASRFDRSLVWHLLCSFEVIVFMFSTYSFPLWNMVNNYYFRRLDAISICNQINYMVFYSITLLMDGAPMYPLWFRRTAMYNVYQHYRPACI
jgi:hypothetical protein